MSLRPDLAIIARHVVPGARVLDVGCGDGALMAALRDERQCDARGLELSSEDVAAAVARGLSVVQGDADTDLADVFVLESHRRRGIARAMIEALHAHPDVTGLRRWFLFTRDMHAVYASLGWEPSAHPDRLMLRDNVDAYR